MERTVPFAFPNDNENGTDRDRCVMKIASWDDMTNKSDELIRSSQNTKSILSHGPLKVRRLMTLVTARNNQLRFVVILLNFANRYTAFLRYTRIQNPNPLGDHHATCIRRH